MANNRVFLVHEPSGIAVFLGKRYGWEYFLTDNHYRVSDINHFYNAVADSEKGAPDNMRIGFEIDENFENDSSAIDNEIEYLDVKSENNLYRVKFRNRHLKEGD